MSKRTWCRLDGLLIHIENFNEGSIVDAILIFSHNDISLWIKDDFKFLTNVNWIDFSVDIHVPGVENVIVLSSVHNHCYSVVVGATVDSTNNWSALITTFMNAYAQFC